MKKSKLCELCRCYYKYCEYLLYLPLSYRNWRVFRKYKAPFIAKKLKEFHDKLSAKVYKRLTSYSGFIRVFCCRFLVDLAVLIMFYLSTIFVIYLFCWFCCTSVVFLSDFYFCFLSFKTTIFRLSCTVGYK